MSTVMIISPFTFNRSPFNLFSPLFPNSASIAAAEFGYQQDDAGPQFRILIASQPHSL
jgi:hypothetical protein